MKTKDTINSMSGILSLSAYDRKNELLWESTSHNLIVLNGYNSIAKALTGVPNMYISQVAVGTNGSPAQESNTQITDAVFTNIQNAEYPTLVSVRFHFQIDYSQAVGMNIREFGLLTNDGRLFSRKVRDVIEKTEHFKIIGIWDINICDSTTPITTETDYNDDYNNDYANRIN